MISIPADAKTILDKLNNAGFEAYVVGGCVRDSILGRVPGDWDICTNALPEQTMQVFEGFHVIPTGLQHGTVTVMINNNGYEITTYRIDGSYSDGRHPDSVSFTGNLKEDLARRDFTVNAMAYSEKDGIMDFYGGMDDIRNGIIRCVGNPQERFTEDALRIMRAVRFAAVLGFEIEENTANAMKELHKNLDLVANERINVEFNKMLGSNNPARFLDEYDYLFFHIIPELVLMKGCEQNNPYHIYDVWHHTLEVVKNTSPNNSILRLAALLHDSGKPHVYTEADGVGHFYGHAEKSVEIAGKVMKRLKYSNEQISEVLTLVKYHDTPIVPTKKFVRRMLSKMERTTFEKLLCLSFADVMGQSGKNRAERLESISEVRQILAEFDAENECFSLKHLKIDGDDLIKMGVKQGRQIGEILNTLFALVLDEKLENEENALRDYVVKNYLQE